MIRHIVIWNFTDDFSSEEKLENAKKIKTGLESLKNIVDGITSINVEIELLHSSNGDIILNSVFKDEESLKNYQSHPEHKKVGNFIASVTQGRKCVDYYE